MAEDNSTILLALGEVKGTLAQLVSAVSRGHSRIDVCEVRLTALEVESGKVGLKVYIVCAGIATVLAGLFHYAISYLGDKPARAAEVLWRMI